MKPRVLLDVDTVLADFLGRCLDYINDHLGSEHCVSDMKTWDVFEAFDVPKDVKNRVYDLMNSPGTCFGLDVLPGAREGYAKLAEVADVYVVTAPMLGETWESERKRWLHKHFGIPTKKVVQTPAKYTVAGDFLIDDRPSNVTRWLDSYDNGIGILWLHEVNHYFTESAKIVDRIYHTSDWGRVIDIVANHKPLLRTWKP